MSNGHKITLEIPDEIFSDIVAFKKKAHLADDKSAICELLKYALTMPAYFKTFDWDQAEAEADAEIAAGSTKSFSSVDDFLTDLKA